MNATEAALSSEEIRAKFESFSRHHFPDNKPELNSSNPRPYVEGNGGGGGGDMTELTRRVGDLEIKMETVQVTLNSIQISLARIEERQASKDDISSLRGEISPVRADVAFIRASLDGKASAESVSEIKGQVSSLPTMPKIAALMAFGIAVCTAILGLYHFGINHHWW